MASRGAGRGRGRGAYYKALYGGGGRSRGGGAEGGRGAGHGEGRDNARGGGGREGPEGGSARPPGTPGAWARGAAPLGALQSTLERIDGSQYPAYKQLLGAWALTTGVTLAVDRVQGDAYAPPSRARVLVEPGTAGLPAHALRPTRRLATADFLARAWADALGEAGAEGAGGGRGGGGGGWSSEKGGGLASERPGARVLERTAVSISDSGAVEARFTAALPARGRTALGGRCASTLLDSLPRAVGRALRASSLDAGALRAHLDAYEDAEALRGQLEGRGLVAFVGGGAVLPRASGAEEAPLDGAVPFEVPEGPLAVELEAPHAGKVLGMGVPRGLVVIAGGGFHGKSTLLAALASGVHAHRAGDGRELVVTDPDAVAVRAEDGRAVHAVDVRAWIGGLPGASQARPGAFSTRDASGSTSQAAAIAEAIEAGASALLLDEDTSAANLLARDARMRALVPGEDEPIRPLLDSARSMVSGGWAGASSTGTGRPDGDGGGAGQAPTPLRGVSVVLVAGSAGDYLGRADRVIVMREYRALDATARARQVAGAAGDPVLDDGAGDPSGPLARTATFPPPPLGDRRAAPREFRPPVPRALLGLLGSSDPRSSAPRLKVRGSKVVEAGGEELDLGPLGQLFEAGQTRAIAQALRLLCVRVRCGTWAGKCAAQLLDALEAELDASGLDALRGDDEPRGDLARPRRHELAAALNRLRSAAFEPARD